MLSLIDSVPRRLLKGQGLSLQAQLLLFLAAAVAVVLRRPDALFHAQFWAEDGQNFYADAYNFGALRALLLPYNGCLHTVPRLGAAASLLLPLEWAPLLMNCIGIAIQVLPITILLSSRCSPWGSLPVRVLYAGVYLALPNSWEINANITNSHFHLALIAVLLMLGCPALTPGWKLIDVLTVLMSGLSGPWSIVFLPLILVYWWIRRFTWSLTLIASVTFSGLLQAAAMLSAHGGARPLAHVGESPGLLVRILGGQILAGALIGTNRIGIDYHLPLLLLVTSLGVTVLFYTLIKAPLSLKLFVVFCFLVLAASLSSPIIVTPQSQWRALLTVSGARYWFLPMLAFLWSLSWCATTDRNISVRRLCAATLLSMVLGVWRDWRYTPYPDKHLSKYAARLRQAPSGSEVIIPINPDGWCVTLGKK